MKHLLSLILLITLCSCKEDKQPIVSPVKNMADTIKAEEPYKKYRPVIVDKSLYSKEFVEYAKKYEYIAPVRIVGDHIEVEGSVVDFPSQIEVGKKYLFTAKKENLLYELTVKRYTPADIVFEYKLIDNGITTIYTGKAHAGLGFWLGSETETDDSTDEGFLIDEYSGSTEDGLCEVTVGIGEPDDNNRIRAIFELHCDNETQNRNISADITLRQHIE